MTPPPPSAPFLPSQATYGNDVEQLWSEEDEDAYAQEVRSHLIERFRLFKEIRACAASFRPVVSTTATHRSPCAFPAATLNLASKTEPQIKGDCPLAKNRAAATTTGFSPVTVGTGPLPRETLGESGNNCVGNVPVRPSRAAPGLSALDDQLDFKCAR